MDIQKKFKFALPNIKGFEFHDEPLNGFHIIVGKKTGSSPKKAVVYFPGGGSRRWQMPSNGSIKKYIGETGAELWIPLYPLAPDYTLLDEVFSGLAPDYEKSFKRIGLTDYEIRIEPNMFHAWPVFTFIKEGRDGEQKVIVDINKFFKS